MKKLSETYKELKALWSIKKNYAYGQLSRQ